MPPDLPLGWIKLPGAGEREDAVYRASEIVRVSSFGMDAGTCHIHLSNGHGHSVGLSAAEVLERIADENGRGERERWVAARDAAGLSSYWRRGGAPEGDSEFVDRADLATWFTGYERWSLALPEGATRWLRIAG